MQSSEGSRQVSSGAVSLLALIESQVQWAISASLTKSVGGVKKRIDIRIRHCYTLLVAEVAHLQEARAKNVPQLVGHLVFSYGSVDVDRKLPTLLAWFVRRVAKSPSITLNRRAFARVLSSLTYLF